MKKTKIKIIIGCAVIAVGILLSFIGLAMNEFKFDVLNYDGRSETKSESFSPYSCDKIRIESTYIGVSVKSGNVKEIGVEYTVRENENFSFEIQNGTLIIKYQDNRKWYDHIGLFFGIIENITVTVPATIQYEYDIRTESGSIKLENLRSETSVIASASSGSIYADEVSANSFELSASSGSIRAESVNAVSSVIGTSSGSIGVEYCEGDSLSANSSSGSIHLKNVTENTINTKSSSGSQKFENVKTDVMKSESSSGSIKGEGVLVRKNGKFESTSGSIRFAMRAASGGYSFRAVSTSGSINLPDDNNGQVFMDVKTTSGSIKFEIKDY